MNRVENLIDTFNFFGEVDFFELINTDKITPMEKFQILMLIALTKFHDETESKESFEEIENIAISVFLEMAAKAAVKKALKEGRTPSLEIWRDTSEFYFNHAVEVVK